MGEKDRSNRIKNEDTCEARSCGCSVNYLLLGLAVFFLLLFFASFIK